jgi:hypothetical protein
MSVLTLPTCSRTAPSQMMAFSLGTNTMQSPSPLNRANQTAELPGARWSTSLSWQNLSGKDARILQAWINRLAGMSGRFYLHDYTHPLPDGTAAGTPLVKTTQGPSIRYILTDGWSPNQTNLLLPGDYIGIGTQLCRITALAASDSGGNATLTFEPPLRSAVPDNTAIITARPTCIMMLKDDKQDNFNFQQRDLTNLQIDCQEMF